MDGPLIEDDSAPLTEDAATLRQDLHCILIECHRDRGLTALRQDANAQALEALSVMLARRLGPRIGGRYVPKRDERASRDAAVWQAFRGNNHQAVMRDFQISRRLLYTIIARQRRV